MGVPPPPGGGAVLNYREGEGWRGGGASGGEFLILTISSECKCFVVNVFTIYTQIEATINNSNQTKGKFSPVPAASRSPTRLKKIPKIKESTSRTKEVSLE